MFGWLAIQTSLAYTPSNLCVLDLPTISRNLANIVADVMSRHLERTLSSRIEYSRKYSSLKNPKRERRRNRTPKGSNGQCSISTGMKTLNHRYIRGTAPESVPSENNPFQATHIKWKSGNNLCQKYPQVGEDDFPDELGSFFNWFERPADAYEVFRTPRPRRRSLLTSP